jgi:hypothetical protein
MNSKAVVLHCLQHHLRKFTQPEQLEKVGSCFEMTLENVDSPETCYLWPRILFQCATTEHSNHTSTWYRTTGKIIALFLRKAGNVKLHTTRMKLLSNHKEHACPLVLEMKGYMPFKEEAFQDLWIPTTLINEFRDRPRDVYISLEEFIEFCNSKTKQRYWS